MPTVREARWPGSAVIRPHRYGPTRLEAEDHGSSRTISLRAAPKDRRLGRVTPPRLRAKRRGKASVATATRFK